jgi:hypothetical protein
MNDYQQILSRLKLILSARKDAEVARALGISTSALSSFKKKEKFPCQRLVKFCQGRGLSCDWLLFGTGKATAGSIEDIRERDLDSELFEILGLLKNENPEAKHLLLEVLKNRKKIKDDLDAFLRLKS